MKFYRISKYNPTQDSKNCCTNEKWTSISDLNTEQMSSYYRIEQNYIDTIEKILLLSKNTTVTIWYLENYNFTEWQEGDTLNYDKARAFITDCLREKCWGQLVSDNFIWESGYDYYMHLGCNHTLSEITQIVKQFNLFVEEWTCIEKLNKNE